MDRIGIFLVIGGGLSFLVLLLLRELTRLRTQVSLIRNDLDMGLRELARQEGTLSDIKRELGRTRVRLDMLETFRPENQAKAAIATIKGIRKSRTIDLDGA
jgi:hypothetical protein